MSTKTVRCIRGQDRAKRAGATTLYTGPGSVFFLPKLKVVIEGIHFDMDQKGHDKQPSENPENVTRRGKRVAWIENGEYHSPRVGLSAH